jgi:Arc/MetJ family transcription regulator
MHQESASRRRIVRRTVVVDDRLLEEARQALGTRSIRATIDAGLRELVRARRLRALRDALGSIELDLTPEELARLREDE